MVDFLKIMLKRARLLLFNLGTILYLIHSGCLGWGVDSIF
jgi:hypothetical protein